MNPKASWLGRYREARLYARISCSALDRLVAFRGFGILRDVIASDLMTVVGRRRINDWRTCEGWLDNARRLNMPPKYNPNQVIQC